MPILNKKEIEADFIKSGERKNLIDTAKKYPNLIESCIDSAYLCGLGTFEKIKAKETQDLSAIIEWVKIQKKEQLDKNDPDNYGACYAIGGFNHALEAIVAHLTSLKEKI